MRSLELQRRGYALHFSGVVDWVIAVLPVPGPFETLPRLIECCVGLGRRDTRVMESSG
ncbi:hypothetical protein BZL30_4439 [Mycobacterium kansasii]|uniref:Uncharacterized protein n=1 Tax=Mycobacterium kansasii TaxID=1768 RepID=A0A1V3X339_MYCKA|nr:hypothetical protein BZL30_4439 [Mycobacterium kansasii]